MFRMLGYVRPYWRQAIVLVSAVAIQAYGVLRLPTLMSQIINQGIVINDGAGDMGFIIITGLKMLGWAVLSAAGALLSSFL